MCFFRILSVDTIVGMKSVNDYVGNNTTAKKYFPQLYQLLKSPESDLRLYENGPWNYFKKAWKMRTQSNFMYLKLWQHHE